MPWGDPEKDENRTNLSQDNNNCSDSSNTIPMTTASKNYNGVVIDSSINANNMDISNNNNDKSMNEKDDVALMSEEEKASEMRQIKINVGVISLVWVFTFTAYSGLQNIESSLNPDIGTYALAALTGGGCITCLLAPALLGRLGCRGALIVSWICLCIFIGGNYYPKAYVLLPAAFIEGLATGLMWTAQGVYVTTSAMRYAQLTGQDMETVLSSMFGVFCMAFQSTQVWGNLISSTVLQETENDSSNNNTTPSTLKCGANNCPSTPTSNSNGTSSPDSRETSLDYILISTYMGFAIIGLVITIFFLKPLKTRTTTSGPRLSVLLLSTGKLMLTDLNMMLLIPFSLYMGVEQSIMFSEFTRAFVTCELGIEWVGYTMLCFGISDTVFSPLAGILGKHVKRPTMFLSAFLLNGSTLAVMLLWNPLASEKYVFFMIPAVWGLGDAVWQTQSAALIGSAFRTQQEPAFASLRMLQALGMTVAYLYSASLCENVKLYIAGALLVLAVALATIVEIRIKKKSATDYRKLDE